MRSYDEICADAQEKAPFANGFEGESWMDRWCWAPCKKDRNEDCPLIMAAYMGLTPKEWRLVNPGGLADKFECEEFEPDDRGGDGEPEPGPWPVPVAEMPGQSDIFAVFAEAIAGEATASRVLAGVSQRTEAHR